MAVTYGNLAQSYPTAGQLVTLYSLSSGNAIISAVWVCNHGAATTFRLSHAIGGATDNNQQYLAYDLAVEANETYMFEVPSTGLSMQGGDVLRCRSGNGVCSFNVYGQVQT